MDNKIPSLQRAEHPELLTQVRPDKAPRSRGAYLLIVLEALSVILAALAGQSYARFLGGAMSIWIVLAALAVFAALSVMATLLAPAWGRRAFVTVLESAAALAFFRNSGTAILIPAFAALLIFSLWGEAESRRRSGNSIRFAFLDFSRAKLKKQVTGLVLCGIILFIPQWSSGRALFTEEQFRPVYGNAVSLAAKLYPDLDLSGSVRDFAYGFAAISLARNKDFKMLPPDQQKAAVTKAGELMIQDARANLGFPISPDTSMSHVFYEYANGFIGNARAQSGSMFIVVAAVVLFMIARSLAAFFTLAAFILAWLLYQVLGALGVVQVIGETATRERLAVN